MLYLHGWCPHWVSEPLEFLSILIALFIAHVCIKNVYHKREGKHVKINNRQNFCIAEMMRLAEIYHSFKSYQSKRYRTHCSKKLKAVIFKPWINEGGILLPFYIPCFYSVQPLLTQAAGKGVAVGPHLRKIGRERFCCSVSVAEFQQVQIPQKTSWALSCLLPLPSRIHISHSQSWCPFHFLSEWWKTNPIELSPISWTLKWAQRVYCFKLHIS